MYIIVVGGGKVGYYLSKSLIEAGHEVLVIEKDATKCAALIDELGVSILQGDGCEGSLMAQVGMERAEVVVAVTGDDEDNLVVCQMAKSKFDVPRTIARINNPRNERIFRELGIDVAVSSTELILSQIETVIPSQSLVHLLTLRNVGVSFLEMEVPAGSPALERPLRELGIPDDCIIPLIIRDGKQAIIPYGDTKLEPGDQAIVVTSEAGQETMRRILNG